MEKDIPSTLHTQIRHTVGKDITLRELIFAGTNFCKFSDFFCSRTIAFCYRIIELAKFAKINSRENSFPLVKTIMALGKKSL